MENNVFGFLKDKHINYVQKGADLHVSCFNKKGHKRGDLNPSLGVDSNTGVFHCWSCKVQGIFPQFIAAMGYVRDVPKYSTLQNTRNLRYDIASLKLGVSGLNIPGIGKFTEKEKDYAAEDLLRYIESKKTNVTDDMRQVGKSIVDSELDLIERIQFIKSIDIDNVVDVPLPDGLYQTDHVSYFSERGLPTSFCKYTEIYLSQYENKPVPAYNSHISKKYFYIPIRGLTGAVKSYMGVSFSKETDPRMYYVGPEISNPVMDFGKIRMDEDLYIVEGWLDHYKMQVMGYNSFPTLSNKFTPFHFSIANAVSQRANVYFVFDQDIAGYQMMKDVLRYVSRTTTSWYATLLPHYRYKDVGDITLTDLRLELLQAQKYPLYQIKKYLMMLGAEKYNESKEVLKSDRYSFRGDPVFKEFGVESFGDRNAATAGQGPRLWEELPLEKERKNNISDPWGLVSLSGT